MTRGRRWLVAAVVVVVGLTSCGDKARDDARKSLVQQLEAGGLDGKTAKCVVDEFFKGKTDQDLKGFFDRPQLTPQESAEFAALGEKCRG
jgi:hypothetical protein